MPQQQSPEIKDVKPVTFESFKISADGEQVIFELCDKSGNTAYIAVEWLKLGLTVQLIGRAAEKALEARRSLGKSDLFDGSGELTPQLVSTFQVSEFPDQNIKLLSLHSPTGLRCDFAIPTDVTDQRGRHYPRAIAEELLADMNKSQQKPH